MNVNNKHKNELTVENFTEYILSSEFHSQGFYGLKLFAFP